MNVLSLFNGISAFHLALDRAGIEINTCYYAEIDKYANQVTEKHYPNDIALGDVTKWREWDIDWSSIDLVGAGFPCQAWSVAGKQLGDKDERGMLFWVTLEIIAHVLKHNPSAKFLMENVKMKKDFEQYITHHTEQALGKVEKTLINSALVSAQNRNRYYWTNFEVAQPEDKGILLKDIIEREPDVKYTVNQDALPRYTDKNGKVKGFRDGEQKSNCLTASMHKGFGNDGCTILKHETVCRDKSQTILSTIYKENAKSMIKRNKMGLVVCGAIRGRYNENGTISQRLELNRTEKTNTLTTVQKDNVVVYRPASIVGRRLNERGVRDDYNKDVAITQCLQVKHKAEKTGCLTTVDKDNVLSTEPPGRYSDIYNRCDISYRKLTPLECERLQTFPDNWTDCISNTQRYKSLGNAWTVDVIAHIFKEMNKCETV